MPTDSVLRRSWALVMGTDRIKAAAGSDACDRSDYTLTRRVLAILLGVSLPKPATGIDPSTEAWQATCTFHSSPSPTLRVDNDVNEYEYFFKLVKSYVAAGAPDRIQSRIYALASLRNLDLLVRVAATENAFDRLSSSFLRVAITVRSFDPNTRAKLSSDWAKARSCQRYFATTLQRTLREAVAQIYDFAIEYATNRTHLLARTEGPTQLEWYMQLLKELQLSNTLDDQRCGQLRGPLVHADPHVYDRSAALELIERIETEPACPPEKKLKDARNALAVASHDFVGADLRGLNLDDVPLDGIRWSRKTTRWPRTWLSKLLSQSTEIAPNILQIDRCNLSS